METPSARSEANSLMLARIAPRSVCEVIATPIRRPRTAEKPSMMPMNWFLSMEASFAAASSGLVQARYMPCALAFSWSRTRSAWLGSRSRA